MPLNAFSGAQHCLLPLLTTSAPPSETWRQKEKEVWEIKAAAWQNAYSTQQDEVLTQKWKELMVQVASQQTQLCSELVATSGTLGCSGMRIWKEKKTVEEG